MKNNIENEIRENPWGDICKYAYQGCVFAKQEETFKKYCINNGRLLNEVCSEHYVKRRVDGGLE